MKTTRKKMQKQRPKYPGMVIFFTVPFVAGITIKVNKLPGIFCFQKFLQVLKFTIV
jgi:hypothetical protein